MDQTPIRPSAHQLRVLHTTTLTPAMRRVTLQAPTLTALPLLPAQDVGLMLTDDSGRPVRKRYTIRNVDPAARTVDLDGILHGHGPGARWFAQAGPGDVVEAFGPRGKLEVGPADWHLFVGDESGLPAFAELIAGLAPGAPARAIVEVGGPAEEIELPTAARLEVTWVHRGPVAAGSSALLSAALDTVALPDGTGQAFLLGESRSVVALRPVLARHGLLGAQVALKGYWNAAPLR